MSSKSRSMRLFVSVLIAGLVGLIVGLPLIALAVKGQSAIVFLTESEDAADGESDGLELGFSELAGLQRGFEVRAPRAYEYRAADDLTGTDAAFADSHLQRGPPAR